MAAYLSKNEENLRTRAGQNLYGNNAKFMGGYVGIALLAVLQHKWFDILAFSSDANCFVNNIVDSRSVSVVPNSLCMRRTTHRTVGWYLRRQVVLLDM